MRKRGMVTQARRQSALLGAGRMGVLAGVAWGAWVTPARAEPARGAPLELRVSYEAPPGCPTGAFFLGALQEHLAEGGDGAVDASVRITSALDGAFELRLALRVGGVLSETQARSESCAALMRLAALSASMARTPPDPNGGAATPISFTPEALRPEALPPEPPSPGPAETEPGARFDAGRPGKGSAVAVGRQGRALGAFALAEVRTAAGMLPGAALGRGIGLGIASGAWSLRLSGTWWLAAQHVFDGDGGSPVSLELEQQSLELAPCAGRALSRVLRLEGCALLAAHRTETSAAEREVWGGLGGAAVAVLRPWRGLRVEAAAQLLVALSAPSYAVQTLEDVYQVGALQPGARLALGWELGRTPRPPEPPPPAFAPLRRAHAGRAP